MTLIFSFLDIFFSVSPEIVESPKISVLPFLHSSFFLYRVLVCVSDSLCWSRLNFLSCVNLFIGMFHCLLYFIYRSVLSFWTAGRLLFGSLSITISKSTPDGLLEEPSTASLLTGASSLQIIGEKFFLSLNSVSVVSSFNDVVLNWSLFFRVGAAKSPFITS